MDVFLELLGWIGAALVVAAYGLLSAKKLSSDHFAYHGLNFTGSALLAIYALWKHAGASVLVNVIWMAIGAYAVFAMRRPERNKGL